MKNPEQTVCGCGGSGKSSLVKATPLLNAPSVIATAQKSVEPVGDIHALLTEEMVTTVKDDQCQPPK